MPAPRKYDQETRDRAIRMYQDRQRDFPGESMLASRRRVGELLDINPATLRGWIERVKIDSGKRPGVPTIVSNESRTWSGRTPNCGEPMRSSRRRRRFRSGGARPPTPVIVDYIDTHLDRFGVELICCVLTEHKIMIAPSTYYARKTASYSDAEWDDAHMANTASQLGGASAPGP